MNSTGGGSVAALDFGLYAEGSRRKLMLMSSMFYVCLRLSTFVYVCLFVLVTFVFDIAHGYGAGLVSEGDKISTKFRLPVERQSEGSILIRLLCTVDVGLCSIE